MTEADNTYKVQLPGTKMGDYTLDDKFLALDNEDNYLMIVFVEQFSVGEIINGGDLIMIADYTEDPITGPWKLYSKTIVDTEELIEVLKESQTATIECKKKVMKGLHTVIAIEPTLTGKLFVMNLSHGHDITMTYKEFQQEYETAVWHINQVIR